MTISANLWEDPAKELREFAAVAGLPGTFKEVPDELTFSEENFGTEKFTTEPTQFQALHLAFEALISKYDVSLSFKFQVGGDELTRQSYARDELHKFCEGLDGSPVSADLKIDKQALAQSWDLTDASTITKLFIFPQALEKALNRSLIHLEQGENALLAEFDGSKKFIIVVPDRDINLDGKYLAVIGGAAVSNWNQYLSKINSDEAKARIDTVLEGVRQPPPRWTGFELRNLTPLQLAADWRHPRNPGAQAPAGTDLIAKRLYSHWLACSLLYLATYSKRVAARPGAGPFSSLFEATFAEDKYKAAITIGDVDEIGDTLIKSSAQNPWEASVSIGQQVDWAYQEKSGLAVRLKVLHNVIGSLLQETSPRERLLELARNAQKIDERVDSRWEGFLDDKLDKYFTDFKALEETVEATSKGYNEQVQSLTKTLTENVLAAVGVVVGSFLAAILTTPFRRQIFLFGTITYLAYLFFFPILMGLFSAWGRYKDSQDSFRKRQQDFINRMKDPELVQNIVGNAVNTRETRFERWFIGTALIYLLIILFMVGVIWKVPGYIKEWTEKFSLTNASYGVPIDGKTVPLTIRGENFDKDNEIVVDVGGVRFTNAGEGLLKVHGSTVLTLSPTRKNLQDAKTKGSITVRQGSTAEDTVQLPADPVPPSPTPTFDNWNWVVQKDKGSLEADGSNFDSIAQLTLDGTRRDFQISENRKKITIGGLAPKTKLDRLEIVLTDGNPITIPVKLNR